jgi:hypothetical protein
MKRMLRAAILLTVASCTGPPFWSEQTFPPLEGIEPGDTAAHVREVLGGPDATRNGWWRSGGVRFESNFQVWYYGGKGRVIFDGFNGRVFQSQADPTQPRHAIEQPFNGLSRPDEDAPRAPMPQTRTGSPPG